MRDVRTPGTLKLMTRPLRVLCCPQEFKGSLTAAEAAAALMEGARRAGADAMPLPLADGGPGTAEALRAAAGGAWRATTATGPLGDPLNAGFVLLGDGHTAVIEMAAAAGLALAHGREDPLRASTYGVGQIIRAAVNAGADRVLVGLGGSATTDGGAGMAQALGIRLLDGHARDLAHGGGALVHLSRADASGIDLRLAGVEFIAMCDVNNPLYGPEGAAHVFAPQKGATPEQVELLDQGLRRLAAVLRRDLGADVADWAGAGAAGGLGAGLMAFLHARLVPGFAVVARETRLADRLAWADIALTGEGRLDSQTGRGKVVAGVARLAHEARKPAGAVVGRCALAQAEWRALGLAHVEELTGGDDAPSSAADAAERATRAYQAGEWTGPG